VIPLVFDTYGGYADETIDDPIFGDDCDGYEQE